MNDIAARIAAVVVVLVLARAAAYVLGRFLHPVHPDVIVGDEGQRPGVVLFTSTDCSSCKKTIVRLRTRGVDFREVTFELEPQRFEAWGITGVPLTVILDATGKAIDLISGVPSVRRLVRSAKAAGVEVHS